MRIIAGKYRSRPLRLPKGVATGDGQKNIRPTSDKLRETLFNVLTAGNPDALEGSMWLDLFAGSGAVGIEALSRGALQVHFVEKAADAAAAIRANLKSLKIELSAAQITQRAAAAALRQLEAGAMRVDFCFLDPPWAEHEAYEEILNQLAGSQILRPSALVIAEHSSRFDPGSEFSALRRTLTTKSSVP